MKKIYLWSLFLISISVLIFSCRKDYKSFFDPKADISSDLEAAKIFHAKGAYLNKTTYAELMVQGSKSVLSTEKIAKKMFFIKLSPLWKDAFEVKAYDGSDLIVVPTPENRLSNKTFEIRRFFIFTKKGGSVVDGKIVEFLGLNYPLKDKMNDIIANYKNSSVSDLTGAIFEYDLNYFRLSTEVIKQGKRTGLTASFHYLPITQTNVSGKVAMGYYDTGAPDANGCSTVSYCEGYYSNGEAGINCNNLGYSTPSNCNPSNPNPTGSDSGYDSSGAYQSGGGSYAGNPAPQESDDISVPNVEPAESDYLYTCPDNFSFGSVTTNNLWQEGVLTNIYVNLGILNPYNMQVSNQKYVSIPEVHFGLARYNVEGDLLFTQNQAKAIAADVLNRAEEDLRKKYKSNPNLSSASLADYWVARMNYYMNSMTNNRGSVGRTGSINPANTPPSRAYK